MDSILTIKKEIHSRFCMIFLKLQSVGGITCKYAEDEEQLLRCVPFGRGEKSGRRVWGLLSSEGGGGSLSDRSFPQSLTWGFAVLNIAVTCVITLVYRKHEDRENSFVTTTGRIQEQKNRMAICFYLFLSVSICFHMFHLFYLPVDSKTDDYILVSNGLMGTLWCFCFIWHMLMV